MPTKYPTTERVTTSRLALDDEVLVRARRSDFIPLQGAYETTGYHAWSNPLPVGRYRVTAEPLAYHKPSGRKASRYYLVALRNAEDVEFMADVSSVQRWNRVV